MKALVPRREHKRTLSKKNEATTFQRKDVSEVADPIIPVPAGRISVLLRFQAFYTRLPYPAPTGRKPAARNLRE